MSYSHLFSIFIDLEYHQRDSEKLYKLFFKKFGMNKTRLMLSDILENDIETALKFIEKYGIYPDIKDIIRILKDPSKSKYHEKAKKLLKSSTGV